MEAKFNSQICTDKNQSERLLALGLKKETADMAMCYVTHDPSGKEIEPEFVGYTDEPMPCEERQTVLASRQKFIPAWSLHRLIILCWNIACDWIFRNGDCYTNAIDCIEWLIKEGHFNKEYLEE